ncbi:MAG: DUF899 family protein [Proteobacteria bacterium]|nr:DUF899 family protein [Burkholderiales bacterium]
MQKITPHLWYAKEAEEAAAFYTSVFPDSRVVRVTPMPSDTPSGPAGSVKVVEFVLFGQPFVAFSAGPLDAFNHAVSFMVACDDQDEIDRYWNAILDAGGTPEQCGWIRDRFGLSWQIAPRVFSQMMADPDRTKAKRATDAMLKMVKFDIAALKRAFDGSSSVEAAPAEAGSPELKPALELAQASKQRFPGESATYRKARTALLAEEIALRRHLESVAVQRRALPPGGRVPEDYRFIGERGAVSLSEMFGDKDTLITYNFMYGAQRERPCPMCTSLLASFDGEMPDILQRVAFAVIARSPIERMVAFKQERGWRYLNMYSSGENDFNRDYAAEVPGGDENPALNVFVRTGGSVRHFWGAEMDMATTDPGQDPRGAPDPMPLWTLLDLTPGGRGKDWYPKLEY